jgi:hypothetical protein
MESTKKRVGRPKSEPRTGPLVLEGAQKRETILSEVSEDTARELREYAVWVKESAPAKMTSAEATSTTIDFALRDVFARDRRWQEHKRAGGGPGGTPETPPPAPGTPVPSAPPPISGAVPTPTILPRPAGRNDPNGSQTSN